MAKGNVAINDSDNEHRRKNKERALSVEPFQIQKSCGKWLEKCNFFKLF